MFFEFIFFVKFKSSDFGCLFGNLEIKFKVLFKYFEFIDLVLLMLLDFLMIWIYLLNFLCLLL